MILKLQEFLNYIPNKKAYVLFGETLSYSISKDIHENIFKNYDIDGEYFYVELQENEIELAFLHLKKYFCGANITIPYKTNFIKYLDEIDPLAKRLGTINTIKIENGKSYGYNTDILGIKDTLELDGIDLHKKNVALLGYGGTANVICDILASNNCNITIFGRNLDKAEKLKINLLKNHPNAVVSLKNLADFDDCYDVIFNATPVGMSKNEGKSPINEIKTSEYVYDCIYNPLKTQILHIAENAGKTSRNGLNMLIKQAMHAQKIWNNIDFSKSNNIEKSFMIDIFKKRTAGKNIIIYGYMGCGKSTIAKALAKITNLDLIDTDDLIEQREGRKISQIFDESSEGYFRNLELLMAQELSHTSGNIVSVGGGFVMNEKVCEILKPNSVFVFLDTNFEQIQKNLSHDKSRPLLKSNDMKILYDKRYSTYAKICDVSITKEQKPIPKAWDIIKNT